MGHRRARHRRHSCPALGHLADPGERHHGQLRSERAGGSFLTATSGTSPRVRRRLVEKLDKAAPRGIHHHYARLSIVTFPSSATDCRTGVAAVDRPKAIAAAAAPSRSATAWTVSGNTPRSTPPSTRSRRTEARSASCPGRYFENVFIEGRRDVVLRGCGWQTRIASARCSRDPASSSRRAALHRRLHRQPPLPRSSRSRARSMCSCCRSPSKPRRMKSAS